MKRYRLTLTTEEGEVLETWTVCGDRSAEQGDEYNINNSVAARTLIGDIQHEITVADRKRKQLQFENPQWHSGEGRGK